jgi:transposase InsO family protein
LSEAECSDDKHVVVRRPWYVNNSNVTTHPRPSDRYTCAVASGTILDWTNQDFFYFTLANRVSMDVRLVSFRIDVKSKIHLHLREDTAVSNNYPTNA